MLYTLFPYISLIKKNITPTHHTNTHTHTRACNLPLFVSTTAEFRVAQPGCDFPSLTFVDEFSYTLLFFLFFFAVLLPPLLSLPPSAVAVAVADCGPLCGPLLLFCGPWFVRFSAAFRSVALLPVVHLPLPCIAHNSIPSTRLHRSGSYLRLFASKNLSFWYPGHHIHVCCLGLSAWAKAEEAEAEAEAHRCFSEFAQGPCCGTINPPRGQWRDKLEAGCGLRRRHRVCPAAAATAAASTD